MEPGIQSAIHEHPEAISAVMEELDHAVSWAADHEGNRPCIAISACLLGNACRYDGQSRPHEAVERYAGLIRSYGGTIRRICPESSGRLSRPRPPAERQHDGRVVDREGHDVTAAFERGAARSVDLVRKSGARLVILKAKSPSCGVYAVYDGTFSGVLTGGKGVCARALVAAGILIADENDVALALERWNNKRQ